MFNKHKAFFTIIFILLSIIFLIVAFTAVQQQKVYRGRAAIPCIQRVCPVGFSRVLDDDTCNCLPLETPRPTLSPTQTLPTPSVTPGICQPPGSSCVLTPCCTGTCPGLPGRFICPTVGAQPTSTPTPTPPNNANPTPTSTPIPTGGPTNQPTQGINPTPTAGAGNLISVTLNLQLVFQGIIFQPAATDRMNVAVSLAGGGLSQAKKEIVEFISDENGVWLGTASFSNIPQGNDYYILVKGEKHVQKKVCDINPSETSPGTYRCSFGKIFLQSGTVNFDFSGIKLLSGDLPDQDGIIDSYDISFIRNNLGNSDEEVLTIGDLNLDARVDTQDYSLLIASLSVKYDEE